MHDILVATLIVADINHVVSPIDFYNKPIQALNDAAIYRYVLNKSKHIWSIHFPI